jgi:hypothetical protein
MQNSTARRDGIAMSSYTVLLRGSEALTRSKPIWEMKLHSMDAEGVPTSSPSSALWEVLEMYSAGKASNGEDATDSEKKAGRETHQTKSKDRLGDDARWTSDL